MPTAKGLAVKNRGKLMQRLLCTVVWFLVLSASLLFPTGRASALDKVSIGLLWIHQAQFAGFYLAQDLGIYEKHGLDVELLAGGPGVSALAALQKGEIDFAELWLAAGIKSKAQGVDLVHLAQLVQTSGTVLVARKDSGIKTVHDLAGRRISLWQGYLSLAPKALLNNHGLIVQRVPQGASVFPFVRGAVDVISAMTYNELHSLYQAGFEYDDLNVMSLSALGYNFPEDGLYAMGSTWRQKPDLCRRVVQATLEGWRAAYEDPDRAIKSVMKRVDGSNLASNLCHQKHMLKTILPLMKSGADRNLTGVLDPREFQAVQRVLLEQKAISTPADGNMMIKDAIRKKP